jgi:hypothetical protein
MMTPLVSRVKDSAVAIQPIAPSMRVRTGSSPVSKAVFSAINYHAWSFLMRWIRAKYKGKHRLGMKELRRRFCGNGWRIAQPAAMVRNRARHRP